MISTHALLAEGDHDAFLSKMLESISTHALLAEGDLVRSPIPFGSPRFQPTPSLRRATHDPDAILMHKTFQPTPSLRRATFSFCRSLSRGIFQPTPSLRRATQKQIPRLAHSHISTHALLAEGDTVGELHVVYIVPISTHALLAEGDVYPFGGGVGVSISTHALLAEGDFGTTARRA